MSLSPPPPPTPAWLPRGPPTLLPPSAQPPPSACPPPTQDRPPPAATFVLLFPTPRRSRAPISRRPRAHARILQTPSPPYSPWLPHTTPPSLSPCAPTPQSHVSVPPHVAESPRALPGPRPARSASRHPPAVPVATLAKCRGRPPSLSAHTTHPLPASSSRLPTRQPFTPVPPLLAHPPPASSSSPAG